MKKIILSLTSVMFLFAGHGDSNDPGMKLLSQGKNKAALEVFKKECKQDNNAWACGNVGLMLYMGMGIKKDAASAKEYYNRGCKMHDIGSCENLGEIAYKEQNMPAAKGYFEKVCGMKKYAKNKIDFSAIAKSCKRAKMIK